MALEDKKISDLAAATALASNDLLVVVDVTKKETKQITLADFKTLGGFLIADLQSDLLVDDLTAKGVIDKELVGANTNGFSNALCIDASTATFIDASAAAQETTPCVGLALESDAGIKELLIQGYIRNDAWTWAPGLPIFLSLTPGLMTQEVPAGDGTYVQILGVARQTNIIFFNPSYTMVKRIS
jgi:hypothetical protein